MRRVFIIAMLSFPMVSMVLPPLAAVQGIDTHANMKALFIYQFAKYVDWPKEYKQGDFNIGILGESTLYNLLTAKYANKPVGSQTIKIKNFSNFAEVTHCHILFVETEHSDKTSELVKKFRSKSTLVVTEQSGQLKEGSVINFVIKDSKQSFELSRGNAEKSKLILGTELQNKAARIE